MSSSSPSRNKATDDPVPDQFVKLVKCALAKMVGAGYLDIDYINRDFWIWFPRKLSNAKNYLKSKESVS